MIDGHTGGTTPVTFNTTGTGPDDDVAEFDTPTVKLVNPSVGVAVNTPPDDDTEAQPGGLLEVNAYENGVEPDDGVIVYELDTVVGQYRFTGDVTTGIATMFRVTTVAEEPPRFCALTSKL